MPANNMSPRNSH
nr:unnamed protein product [Callosobruchus analis]CAI5857507.1 unnamed protein product [Callosobruchus analis]